MAISPLNSVPKKDSLERRVIVDLSFPKSHCQNPIKINMTLPLITH
jgi:hypothetical protein